MDSLEECRKAIEEDNQDRFLELLAGISAESCFYILSNTHANLYSQPNSYYLKHFLLKIKDMDNTIIVPQHVGSIQRYLADVTGQYHICGHGNLDHIILLLDLYVDKFDPSRIKLFTKILAQCMYRSEPNRDPRISTAVFSYPTEPDLSPVLLNKLTEFLVFYKEEVEHIWSKEHIGEIIDEAIKRHKFQAVRLLIGDRQYIDDVVHKPLTELVMYYHRYFYMASGLDPTAKLGEVVEFYVYLAGKHRHLTEEGLFFSTLRYLRFSKTVHVLECLYDTYGEEKINDLLLGNAVLMSVKLHKAATGDIWYDRVQRLIEGDKKIWTNTKIGAFLRRRS